MARSLRFGLQDSFKMDLLFYRFTFTGGIHSPPRNQFQLVCYYVSTTSICSSTHSYALLFSTLFLLLLITFVFALCVFLLFWAHFVLLLFLCLCPFRQILALVYASQSHPLRWFMRNAFGEKLKKDWAASNLLDNDEIWHGFSLCVNQMCWKKHR